MRILIVEDEVKIANALRRGLEQEKYAVDAVYDGREGMAFALTEPYDLIILDRMLPGVSDGLEICAQLREKGIATPVLMLTAKGDVRERVKGLNEGADDYLAKPFAFEELLARVRALLRRPAPVLGTVLRVGDLSLDTRDFTVRRGSRVINLSAKECALLEFLMRNTGKVVTKDTIIEHVWDYDTDVLPNTVEVYIGYLRGKIDKPFKHALIHTVRGFGYTLKEVHV